VKNRAAQGGFGELRDKRPEFRGEHEDALGLQGATDSSEGLGEMTVNHIDGFGRLGARCDRAFEEMGENETTFLEVAKHFFGGLPCRGNAKCSEKIAGLASKRGIGRIEKV